MAQASFRTALMDAGSGLTGIVVPPEAVAALGRGKRPPVWVRVNGYAYQSTVSVMGGAFMLPFALEHRKATGLQAGDVIAVTLTLETAPRVVEVPEDLAQALAGAGLRAAFDACSPSRRKEMVRGVMEAKAAETRARRVGKVVGELAGKERD